MTSNRYADVKDGVVKAIRSIPASYTLSNDATYAFGLNEHGGPVVIRAAEGAKLVPAGPDVQVEWLCESGAFRLPDDAGVADPQAELDKIVKHAKGDANRALKFNAKQRFRFGVTDCATFAADVNVVLGKPDPAGYRGQASTRLGVEQLLKRLGGGVEKLFEGQCDEIGVEDATQDGDILTKGQATGVVIDGAIYTRTPLWGPKEIERSAFTQAWRVRD